MGEAMLALRRCRACGTIEPGARSFCASCGSGDLAPELVDGRGTVLSWTVVRRPSTAFRPLGEIPIAVVRLDAGATLTGRFSGSSELLTIGREVALGGLEADVPIFVVGVDPSHM